MTRLTRYEDIEAERRADLNTEIAQLRAEVERLTRERDEAREGLAIFKGAKPYWRERAEAAERERDEALPWKMFYGDGKTLGEIAAHFGKSIYDFLPWLTAPSIRS